MRTILIAAAFLACAACQQPAEKPAAPVDTTADAEAIKAAEQSQIAAIQAKDGAKSAANYSDDAIFVEESGKVTQGSEAIKAAFAEMAKDPALAIDYQQGKTVVSSGGDMAYSTATYSFTVTDPKSGKPVTTKGSNLSVWQKQADGSWKLVADNNAGAPVEQ